MNQADKTWSTPVTNWLGAAGVKDPLAAGVNAGSDGHAGEIHDWTGMLADQERRKIVLIGGGGHIGAGGYKGNEVYECDLSLDAPAWVRKRNATDSSIGGAPHTYADGRPHPDHNAQTWLAAFGRWLQLGMEVDNQGFHIPNVWWEYDPFRNDYKSLANTYSISGRNGINSCAIFDEKLARILRLYDNATFPGIVAVRADTLAVLQQVGTFQTSSTITAAIDATRDLLVVRYPFDPGGAETFEIWNAATLTKLTTLTASGTPADLQSAIHYHKPSDAFVTWSGGSSIRKLTPTPGGGSYTALAWSSVASLGGPSPPSTECAGGFSGEANCFTAQGLYTKVGYMKNMGNGQSALVVVPQYFNPDVFVFKLPNGPLT